MRYVTGCLVSAILGGLFAVALTDSRWEQTVVAQDRENPRGPSLPRLPGEGDPTSPQDTALTPEGLSPEESINVAVYEKVNKGVVNITTRSSDGFFLLDVISEGAGSGSVIDKSGHILTNYHVIEDARQVTVTLYDGKAYEATFVGADPVNDVAVLKVDAPADVLHPVTLGDSSRLQVGMRVFAIGNPFGLERTMTTGIISSVNRALQVRGNRTIKSIIQIDAAINPGNSGGPLLDSQGRLIGINTAIASRVAQNSGVGFAIPINLVARVVPQLIKHGRVIRPDIGIQRVYETEKGLLVARLKPGGPAEKAGLRGPKVLRSRRGPFVIERIDRSAADLIIAVDGQEVRTADDFLSYIEKRDIGDQVELTILREGRRMKIPVTLDAPE